MSSQCNAACEKREPVVLRQTRSELLPAILEVDIDTTTGLEVFTTILSYASDEK